MLVVAREAQDMEIYNVGLTSEAWRNARRRRLHVGVARAHMETLGGLCHEHSGVVILVFATDSLHRADV